MLISEWSSDVCSSDLHVVPACGRGTRLQVPAGWLSLPLPLSGRLQFESAVGYWVLPAGRLQPWRAGSLRVSCHAPDLWLALSGLLRSEERRVRKECVCNCG